MEPRVQIQQKFEIYETNFMETGTNLLRPPFVTFSIKTNKQKRNKKNTLNKKNKTKQNKNHKQNNEE